ncbi:hypothetical protein FH957_002138 [Enterococcus faecium]|nr:hypothetical protein [Enterococcus faecium]
MIRRVAVINTRTDKVEFEAIGRISVDTEDKNKLVILVETGKNQYKKHLVKMFDPVLIDQKIEIDKKRKEKAEEKGWKDFYKELNHEELAGYGFDVENNRLYLVTHGKPSDDVRALLKKAALRWSPRNKRWQRILTVNAINSVNRNVMNGLGLPQMEEK